MTKRKTISRLCCTLHMATRHQTSRGASLFSIRLRSYEITLHLRARALKVFVHGTYCHEGYSHVCHIRNLRLFVGCWLPRAAGFEQFEQKKMCLNPTADYLYGRRCIFWWTWLDLLNLCPVGRARCSGCVWRLSLGASDRFAKLCDTHIHSLAYSSLCFQRVARFTHGAKVKRVS
jgi:hypothetical protein